MQMHPSKKSLKIQSLREQIESFVTLRMPGDGPTAKETSFRVASTKHPELNNTYTESWRKKSDDYQKKYVSPYCEPQSKAIKKVQRSRIPKTACVNRLEKLSEAYNNIL